MASSAIENSTKKVNSILEKKTQGSIKDSGLKALALMGVSYVGGNLVASVIGKPSFLVGLGLTVAGCYKENNHWLAPLGLGMMTAPTKGETIKDRMIEAKDNFLSKTYLDKVINSKPSKGAGLRTIQNKTEEEVEGFGSIEANQNVLDQVEQQLIQSAINVQERNSNSAGMQGYESEMNGTDDVDLSTL